MKVATETTPAVILFCCYFLFYATDVVTGELQSTTVSNDEQTEQSTLNPRNEDSSTKNVTGFTINGELLSTTNSNDEQTEQSTLNPRNEDSSTKNVTGFTINAVCLLPLVKGPCKQRMDMFYYDSHDEECKLFTYSGCDGNANRFEFFSECAKICRTTDPYVPVYGFAAISLAVATGFVCGLVVIIAFLITANFTCKYQKQCAKKTKAYVESGKQKDKTELLEPFASQSVTTKL